MKKALVANVANMLTKTVTAYKRAPVNQVNGILALISVSVIDRIHFSQMKRECCRLKNREPTAGTHPCATVVTSKQPARFAIVDTRFGKT